MDRYLTSLFPPSRPRVRGVERSTGCSAAVARLIWDQEVAGSNPATQTLESHMNPNL